MGERIFKYFYIFVSIMIILGFLYPVVYKILYKQEINTDDLVLEYYALSMLLSLTLGIVFLILNTICLLKTKLLIRKYIFGFLVVISFSWVVSGLYINFFGIFP